MVQPFACALAIVVQRSVAGSTFPREHRVVSLLNPGPLVPPVTSTLPSGSSVALIWPRANAMDPTGRQAGVAAFRSITSARGSAIAPPSRAPSHRHTSPKSRSLHTRGVVAATTVHAPVPNVSR